MPKAERIPWIDTGRGIAIALVTLYHATNWMLGAGFHVEAWRVVDEVMASLRMPLFFALSGVFAPKWLSASWSSLFRSKVLLFLWVFVIWETIGSLFFQIGLVMQGKCCGLRDTVVDLLLAPILPVYELWFIWALAIFFIIAKLARRIDFRIQLAATGVLSFFALTGWDGVNDGWAGVAKYFFFFLSGLYLRQVIIRFGTLKNWWVLAGAFLVWAAVSLGLEVFGLRGVIGLYFLNCVIGLFGGVALSRMLTPTRVLARIGKQTLPIYLSHTPIILVLVFVMWQRPLFPIFQHLEGVMPAVLTALAIIIALALHRLAQRSAARYLYEPPRAWTQPRVPRQSDTGERTQDVPSA